MSGARHRVLIVLPDAFYLAAHWAERVRAAAELYEVTVAVGGADRELSAADLGTARRVGLVIGRGRPSPLREWQSYRQIRGLIREVRPHLVHAATARPVVYAGLAARHEGVPARLAAITGLGYLFGRSAGAGLLRPLGRAAYRRALGGDGSLAAFEHPGDRDTFVSSGIVAAERTRVIPAGLDLATFPFVPEATSDEPLVILPSRLLAEKGVREFAEAAANLRSAGVRARFALVGDVDPGNPNSLSQPEVEAIVRRGAVEWWGFRRDIAEVLRAAAVVCLPSYYREGMPRILMEAAAVGRPAVAVDAPGLRDVVADGETGLLVPARDTISLAAALRALLSDPALRARMGRAARRRAESRFSAAENVRLTLDAYRDLLAGVPAE